MVVAKTQLANDVLTAAFAARDLDRAYVAWCWGLPQPLAGEIEGAIGRDKRDRKRMAVVGHGGKAALTRYRTMRAGEAAWRCWNAGWRPGGLTKSAFTSPRRPSRRGRSAIIRRVPAAAKTMDQPLRGQLLDFPRQALHAATLGFAHPRTGNPISFQAEMPEDMAALFGMSIARCPAAERDLILTGPFQSCIRKWLARAGALRRWGRPVTPLPLTGRVAGT